MNRRLSALRSVIKIANQVGYCTWMLNVDSVKARPYRDTTGPGVAAIAAMVSALDADTPKAT